jgi:hypothetical protein
MTLNIISSDFFLPLGSVKLGRLVKSVEYPTQNYPYPQAPEETPNILGQYTRISQGESSTGFATKLTSLMSSGFSKRANARIRIETNAVKTYTLDNSEAWFTDATNFKETRRWIERAIGGDGVYLVVGFHTVTDARIVHEWIEGYQLAGQVTLPFDQSLAAVGAVAPLGNIVDPVVSGNQTVLDGAKTQFVAPGEQVCALQYRKVSYRWLHSKKLDNLTLSKVPRWTAGDSWRKSSVGEAEDEPDLLEVETEAFEQPEGDWEKAEDEDGEVLLIRSVKDSDEF